MIADLAGRENRLMPPLQQDLGVVSPAHPCYVKWSELRGDARVRCCTRCKLKIYDLSQLDLAGARALLLACEGRLRFRFWKRADGTLLTRNCGSPRESIPQILVAFLVRATLILLLC